MSNGIELGEARILAPGRWRWLRALAWLVALAAIAVVAFNLAGDATLRIAAWLDGTAFTTRADAPDGARLAAVMVGSAAMLGAYWLAVTLGENRSASELRLRPLAPETLAGLALGGLLIAAIVGALVAGGWAVVEPAPITHVLASLKETVQSALIEEVLFRLIVLRLLWRAFGVWPALALSAALFGALHLSNPDATPFAAACLIAGEGIGIGLYMLSGRIWLSIGMHAGWNFTLGWIFGSAVSGVDSFAGGPLITRPVAGVAEVLGGGGFGPEATLASLAISAVASALLLRLAWSKGRFHPASASAPFVDPSPPFIDQPSPARPRIG